MSQDERGYRSEYSAYGGHVIEDSTPGADALKAIGITDHEQLVAALAVPSIQEFVEQLLRDAGADPSELRELSRDSLPETAFAAFDAPASTGVFALGVMEPTEGIRAEIASLAVSPPAGFGEEVAALPPSVNFSKNMPPIRQQGSRGTCVAFTQTAAHEYWRIASGQSVDLSEQFLYQQTKQIDGSAGCGTWQVKAAQVLTNTGQCREPTWPYNPAPPCNNNGVQPGNAAADAASYKIKPVVLQPKDVLAIKSALAAGSCVGLSLAVYNSWYQSAYVRQTGRINMRVGSEPGVGGHAICCIGYQDDASQPGGGVFIIRNHWGTGWGVQCPYGAGNGTLPYAYIGNEGWEAVAMPPPRRRFVPRPWDDRRIWPFTPHSGGDDDGIRPTVTIDTQGRFDIVIK